MREFFVVGRIGANKIGLCSGKPARELCVMKLRIREFLPLVLILLCFLLVVGIAQVYDRAGVQTNPTRPAELLPLR
ncbi:MAG: hypothetical protein K2W95_15360 [Candidatus Obscuribacterales bacterium]|nr:hypothetical protein [Candidatus Obscuribacterales bacterium]